MLTGMGASMHVTTARELIVTLRHLHDHPESLKALLINGEVLRRPHAAEDIAIATMELAGKPQKRKRAFCRFYWEESPRISASRMSLAGALLYHSMLKHSRFAAKLRVERYKGGSGRAAAFTY
ncbi:MAG: hypothetical protein ACLU0O_09735 [Collinsella sp.]